MVLLGPGIKSDPVRRWALPDRTFFAAGACHILAYAFHERFLGSGFAPHWIRPAEGHTGNHIVMTRDDWSFDYLGFVPIGRRLSHHWRAARRRWPTWDADVIRLPPDVLISGAGSRRYPGLHLRAPGGFLHDALPRARSYLDQCVPAVPTCP